MNLEQKIKLIVDEVFDDHDAMLLVRYLMWPDSPFARGVEESLKLNTSKHTLYKLRK